MQSKVPSAARTVILGFLRRVRPTSPAAAQSTKQQKNAPMEIHGGAGQQKELAVVSLGEALAAVNRAVTGGLEGNSCFLAALGADSSEHLSGSTIGSLAGVTASLASLGLVYEASLSVELLLTSGEDELIAALFASQSLVSVHDNYLA